MSDELKYPGDNKDPDQYIQIRSGSQQFIQLPVNQQHSPSGKQKTDKKLNGQTQVK
jgi:hypothetical protein